MQKSNIQCSSNLFICQEEWLKDYTFIEQIVDYGKLKNIQNCRYGTHMPTFSAKQEKILRMGLRCIYAKNDPCWGYIQGKGTVCKCINGECDQINKCNPNYSEEYKKQWEKDSCNAHFYGNPRKQNKYYIVDLISQSEKHSYFSEPESIGKKYPVLYTEKKERKKIVIGFETTRFNDYCDESIQKIYAYEDEIVEPKRKTKYGSTLVTYHRPYEEKYSPKEDEKYSSFTEVSQMLEVEKEQSVAKTDNKINIAEWKEKKITLCSLKVTCADAISEITKKKVTLIFENEGQLLYNAGVLQKVGVDYNIHLNTTGIVLLSLGNDLKISNDQDVFIANSIFQKDKELLYLAEELSGNNFDHVNMGILEISNKDYFHINDYNIWGCRGIYGVTHIQLQVQDVKFDDINKMHMLQNSKIEFDLIKNDNNQYYTLIDSKNEVIGNTNERFMNVMRDLLNDKEIISIPDSINGFVLCYNADNIEILGMGHMKFAEY